MSEEHKTAIEYINERLFPDITHDDETESGMQWKDIVMYMEGYAKECINSQWLTGNPKESGEYIVTSGKWVGCAYFNETRSVWYDSNEEQIQILAYRPLPEAYKPEKA